MVMGNGSTTIGDLFRPCDRLPGRTRLAISTLVASPGVPLAILPGQLAALPLPGARAIIDEIVALITAADARPLLTAINDLRFDQVVPAVADLGGGPAAWPCPARLLIVLEQYRRQHWSDLASLRISTIQTWTNAGPGMIMALLGVAMNAAIDELCPPGSVVIAEAAHAEPDPTSLLSDLRVILHDDAGSALRITLETLATRHESNSTATGDEIAVAAARLLALPAPLAAPHPVLVALDQILCAIGTRDRVPFEHLDLPFTRVPSAASVAAALDISPERIRQLRFRGRARVRAGVAALGQDHPLHAAVGAVAEGLGFAVPIDALDGVLQRLGLPSHHDTRSQLMLHLAGPYRPVKKHPGWVASNPTELTAATHALLREDGGVRLADQVLKELGILGLLPSHADAWIADQPVRVVGDLVVLTAGPPTTVVERALNATAASMNTTELAAWVCPSSENSANPRPSGRSWVGGVDQLRRSLVADARFCEVAPDEWELAEWGGIPHFGPPDERTFATRYGPVTLTDDLAQPFHGSARPIALESGGAVGDTLFLGFRPTSQDLQVERRIPNEPRLPFPTT